MTNQLTRLFSYEGNQVTFKNENGVTYVNATQMGKRFGKTPKDYLRTQIADELTSALSSRLKCLVTDLVQVINGGNNRGTWMHEDVALDYAQWLSIDFRLWCNDRLKELITHGITATPSTIEDILNNPDNTIKLLQALQSEREEKTKVQEKLVKWQPAMDYVNIVMQSESVFLTTQVAAGLGMSAKALNLKLKNLGIQRSVRGQWVLNTEYMGKGYDFVESKTVGSNSGGTKTIMQMLWTELGKAFIHSKVNPVMIESFKKRAQFLTPSN